MIHLVDNYYLDSDDNCLTLIEWDGTTRLNKGREDKNIRSRRYYSSLADVFRGLHKALTRKEVSRAVTMDELLQGYHRIEKTITDLLDSGDAWSGPA